MRLAILLSLLASACASGRTKGESDYKPLLERWTRHGELLHDFDAALAIDATLHSPEFQEAYAAKWAAVYRLDPPEAARVRAQLLTEVADHYDFFVDTAAHDYALNDLSSTKTVWRVSLRDDQGHEVLPSQVTLARELRELTSAFYPYASLFGRSWHIRFPHQLGDKVTPLVGPDTQSLTLRIAGPDGSIDLVWKLK